MRASIPSNEEERLAALRRFQILDTPSEEAFDRITRAVAHQLKVPVALVTFVDQSRQWFKSRYGLDISETPREVAFCAHALEKESALAVPDATQDERFSDNPFVTGEPGIRSYCGAPLRLKSGVVLGTLCVVDFAQRNFTEDEAQFLDHMASVVVELLEFRLSALTVVDQERAAARAAEVEVEVRDAELRDSEERFADLVANLPGLVYRLITDPKGERSFSFMSKGVLDILGVEAAAVLREPEVFFAAVHPDDSAGLERTIQRAQKTGRPWQWEWRMIRADGEVGWFRGYSTPRRTPAGSFICNGIILDVTERVQAEERFRQAQKMEAVGQMTGGVAHDFNNLLAVVQGNIELLSDEVGDANPAVEAIKRVSERGAELTERLLVFSRKQSLSPQVVDLSQLVQQLSGLIKPILGARIAIKVTSKPDLWPALADPGQVENALVNLALNACDAMPSGGQLTVSCENAVLNGEDVDGNWDMVEGNYVAISVADSGAGMTDEIKLRAYEPFFTTKPAGQGSGLGLSMVYGFVRQSGGHITIDSSIGKGSKVTLYLPKAATQPASLVLQEGQDQGQGRGERVLVIEDDPDVKRMVARMLEHLGYAVLEAEDVAAARQIFQSEAPIDLVLSDVMLPGGESGPDFAAEVRAANPDLPVIFMSGYPADETGALASLSSSDVLLRKPFQRQQLSQTIQAALKRLH